MDPIAAELQTLRNELRRTRRGLVALALAGLGVLLSAQASTGPKELRVNRLVIGTVEKGIVLEANEKSGARISLGSEQGLVSILANGNSASIQVAAKDRENPKIVRAVGVFSAGAGALTGVSVSERKMSPGDDDITRTTAVSISGVKVTEMPEHGKVKTLGSLP